MRVIIEDTRQQPTKNAHIRLQLEKLGYKVERSKMYVGDYQFADSGKVVVDTKKDLQEVCGNLTQQHERFKEECVRAKEAGIRLVILIQDQRIQSLNEVPSWYNWRLKQNKFALTGKKLYRIMATMVERYGVEWQFTTRAKVGERVVDILEGRS